MIRRLFWKSGRLSEADGVKINLIDEKMREPFSLKVTILVFLLGDVVPTGKMHFKNYI